MLKTRTGHYFVTPDNGTLTFVAPRLAAGIIRFEQVGPRLPDRVVTIPHEAARYEAGVIDGNIQILHGTYRNVWTNIDRETFRKLGLALGDPLLYLNSLDTVSLAINQGNFAARFQVASGPEWSIRIHR